jgi:exonuclease III
VSRRATTGNWQLTVREYCCVIRLLSWNMAGRHIWDDLHGFDADVALVQEARQPPPGAVEEVVPGDVAWRTDGYYQREWRTAVARLSDRVRLRARPSVAIQAEADSTWTVSREGTITAVDVLVDDEFQFTVASVYAVWETSDGRGYADAAAHRILSDLSWLTGTGRRHRLVVAGDWNILYGYGEHGSDLFAARYQTVFDRAAALGLRYVGPRWPEGRQADPWPDELPRDSTCVPTFHHSQQTPASASRQLDFVFASEQIADRVVTRAINEIDEWGPSDHCRVVVDVDA